jgi:hypothetical protein
MAALATASLAMAPDEDTRRLRFGLGFWGHFASFCGFGLCRVSWLDKPTAASTIRGWKKMR